MSDRGSSPRVFEYVVMGAAVFAALGYVLPAWFRQREAAARERELARLCSGDRLKADLLVSGKMTCRPGLPRTEAVKLVLEELGDPR